ncbi:UNVERIFIED_CONTAM: hypothetical protein Sangu_1868900 [Sesamum angustifolium]|uniref:SWIM-type domain-containing protein n=1 Tax=Sesamum angustifolium TaxID=2727405 RepID=A0AAW2LXB5_9LAMI
MHKFKTDPKRGIKRFRVDAIEEIRCNITKNQAARAKRLALLMLEGSATEQYALLWDYADEIKRSNPGFTVILGTEQEGSQNMFDRFYVCLQALKLNFLNGCRPVICIDGCHLKGAYGGVLLSVVSIDPNNNFFPICYVVVMKENKDTWDWFLTLLKMDLRVDECGPMTFMSDKQKGLVGALQELFPNAEHRFCVRHLHSNFKNYGFRGLAFKNILWKAARATTVNEFTRIMQEMKELDEGAFAWFNDKNPKEWSRSHFSCYPRNIEKLGDCIPIKSDDKHYQISCFDGAQYSVDLENATCGCRKWDLSGIPCKHAISAIFCQGENIENYTHQCYRVEKYLKVYEHAILPINGRKEWKKSDFVPPVPPNLVKKVGRPRKTRRLEPDEPVQKKKKRKPAPIFKEGSNKIKRQQTTVKCGKCGVQGHNARTCQGPVIDVVTDAASQVMGRNEAIAEAPNEAVAEALKESETIPQKLKVRRKGKEPVHKEVDWSYIEEQGVDISHQPLLSSYLQKLQQQRQQCLNIQTMSKGVKIREPASFIDGERQNQEVSNSGSTPSIVKGGKRFVTLSYLSEAVNEGKQKKDKGKKKCEEKQCLYFVWFDGN